MDKLDLCILGAVCFISAFVLAQPPARLVSPEVQADGRVTFRLRAPNAQKVEVEIERQRAPTTMQKDEHGIWSVQTGPLQPDIYGYSFIADGTAMTYPSNPLRVPNLLNPGNAVHVPGPTLPWELNQAPHGVIHPHFF